MSCGKDELILTQYSDSARTWQVLGKKVAISRKTILGREQDEPGVEVKARGLRVKQVSQHGEGGQGPRLTHVLTLVKGGL